LKGVLKKHSSNIFLNNKSDIQKTTRCLDFPRHLFFLLPGNSSLGDCEEVLYLSEISTIQYLQLGSCMSGNSGLVHFVCTVNSVCNKLMV